MYNKSREFEVIGDKLMGEGRILDKSATALRICPKARMFFLQFRNPIPKFTK